MKSVWIIKCVALTMLVGGTLPQTHAGAADGRMGKLIVGGYGVHRTTEQLDSAPRVHGFRVSSTPTELGSVSKADDPDSELVEAGGVASSTAQGPISNVSSFDGPTLESDVFPPDTQGDVGPTQFVVMLNTRVRSYSKATGQPDGGIDAASDVFWAPAMTPVGIGGCNFVSDPHIRYDRLSGRWIAIMIDVPNCDGTQSNRIMLAVSDGHTIGPSTVWTFFHIDVTAGELADYPTLGVDVNALYIGTNQFATSDGSFVNTNGYVVRKSSILGAGPIVSTSFGHLIAIGSGPFTPQGVDDPNAGIDVGYFIGVDYGLFGRLDLLRVTDPGGPHPSRR